MKKFLTIAVVLMTLLVLGAGSAWAWSARGGDRVTVATNDRGDLLFNQFYLALDGGWVTDIWVANMRVNTVTQRGRSIVAKLTVNSGVYSRDIRDINIYLTPGDVCLLRLYYNTADGLVYLYSEDGSVRNNTNTAWASAADPLNVALIVPTCGDSQQYGYVTIMEICNSANVVGTTNLAAMSPSGANSPERIRASYLVDAGAGVVWNYGGAAAWDGNWLTGYTEIRNTTVGLTSGQTTMLAMRDYRNLAFGFETQIMRIGNNARSNMMEVESVLATITTTMPFVNDATFGVSLITHTFPTKYAWASTNPLTCVTNLAAGISQFFAQNLANGRVAHMRYAVDMNENLRMSGFSPNLVFPDEVNGVFTDAAHDPVLFSTTMNMGYMITEFDQLANYRTVQCRAGLATDVGLAACPLTDAAWAAAVGTAAVNPTLYVDPTGVNPPLIQVAVPVAPYVAATLPQTWAQATSTGSAFYPPIAWPGWVNTNAEMIQYLYGVAFTGVPVIPAELRFGGQSFSLNACAYIPGILGTTISAVTGFVTGILPSTIFN